MKNLKKCRLYRVGSALMAAAMVFTCMPQTGLYVWAEEALADTEAGKPGKTAEASGEEQDPQPEDAINDGQPDEKQDDSDPAADGSGGNNDQPGADAGNTEPAAPEQGEDPDGAGGDQPEEDAGEDQGNKAPEDNGQDDPGVADPDGVIAAAEGDAAEKQELTVDFITRLVTAKDKTYDGQEHSISGCVLWTPQDANLKWTYKLTAQKLHDHFPEPKGEKTKADVTLLYNDADGFAKAYEEIAPTQCGRYTLEISAALSNAADQDKYEFEEDDLKETFTFSILPLQREEANLVGVTGITDKDYDGQPVRLDQSIRNVKVQTNKGVDITEKVELKFRAEGKTEDGTEYSQIIATDTAAELLPVAAGSYTLYASLKEDGTYNYEAREWAFPFVIRRQAVTVAVNDQEMHVRKGDPIEAGTPLSQDDFDKDLYQIDGILESEKDDFVENLTVNVQQNVVLTQTGIYDLEAAGIRAEDWPDYNITYTAGKLTVKARLKRVEDDGVLKAVTNVTNGLTLAQIAEQYLSKKTAVIYLANGAEEDADKDSVSSNDIRSVAQIEWDTEKTAPGTSYNEKETKEQKFKMQGKVVLPELVYTEKEETRTVTVEVNVREAYGEGQALMPVADIAGGTVSAKTQVRLSTPEEGASIYYTEDGSDPRTSKTVRLYSSAIEINRTTTIRAVSRIYGKRDSEVLRVTYYWTPGQNPGGEDPDDPDNPTVPDEDIPKDENGKPMEIPKDMWVTDVAAYTYTGKAIKPEVRVYDYKKRLEEKKDYTISYKNNINAVDKNAVKAPTIVITGKGNYEGKLNKTFTIAPKNITDADVKTDDLTVAFNNKQQKPVPAITWNGKKLSGTKDYSVSIGKGVATGSEVPIGADSYPITLTGKGNYTGERKITFLITQGTPVPKLTVSKIAAYTYTGAEIKPEPTVKNGKEVLEKDKDYKLTYEDNKEVGTASVIITGTGASGGSKYFGVKRVNFQIKAVALMSKAKVAFDPAVYTGNPVEPACTVTLSLKVNGVTENRTLVRGTDYTVTYQNNVKAGTATAVFEGKGFYGGTLKKTYKVNAYDLMADPDKKMGIQTLESYPYMKGGSMPKPVVRFNGKKLTEGTDYTLSYKNHGA
ncbi:MAG: chitobiase/beta-hexosaminidase C-terminal domain-containing protein, partial [Lachnospiraceae bacterium]|nr:chitobiase/beta-hexosaminidase C-terminal domain-containing protein [Lachnospiraceae bacterium]